MTRRFPLVRGRSYFRVVLQRLGDQLLQRCRRRDPLRVAGPGLREGPRGTCAGGRRVPHRFVSRCRCRIGRGCGKSYGT